MGVGFHNVGYSADPCSICLCLMDDIEDVNIKGGIIAHDENGDKHPWHSECIKEALKVYNLCPCCRIPLDASALFNWKERTVNFIKKDDGLTPTIAGALTIVILTCLFGIIIHGQRTDFNNDQSRREFALQTEKKFVIIIVASIMGIMAVMS